MSLVSTYVRATDGQFYKNPVIEGDNWFICFDDREPPEMVVKEGAYPPELAYFQPTSSLVPCGQRVFEQEWDFAPARHQWGKLVGPIPVPDDDNHDGKCNRPPGGCVIYDPQPKDDIRE